MQEFDYKLARTIQTIQETELYSNTSEICHNFTEHQKLYLTSYFGLTIAVSLADGKVYKSELDYISNSLPKNLNLDKDIRNSLVELNISHAILAKGYSTVLPHFVKYLDLNMNDEAKLKVIRLLFNLAYADHDLDPLEDQLITNLSKRFSIPEEKINLIRNHCKEAANKVEVKENVSVEFLKNVRNVYNEAPINRKSLQSIDPSLIENYLAVIRSNPICFFIKKICKNLPDNELLFISSYLGLTFALISADGEIHEKEVNYIKHEFSTWFEFDNKTIDMLIDLSIYISETKKLDESLYDTFLEILDNLLSDEEKQNFTKILVNLAESDENVSPFELLIIDKATVTFHLNKEQVEDIKEDALGIDGSFRIIRSASAWDFK